MKKILFIIEWYPSVRSANVLCDTNIIKALLATKKYEVHCLVYKPKGMAAEEFRDGIFVHRVEMGWFRTLFIDSYKDTSSMKYRILFKFNRINLRLRQLFTIPIYPIDTPFLIRKLYKKAYELNKKENFDLVISEHNGIDALLAGYFIKNSFPTIKFLPILWDPLLGKELAKYLPYKYANWRMKRIDEMIMNKADAVISMESNEKYLRSIAKVSYLDKVCFMGIPRFIRPSLAESLDRHRFYKVGCINILYGGVMTSRSIDHFIEACNAIKVPNIHLIFLVSSPTQQIKDSLDRFNGSYSLNTYLPHEELMGLMQQVEFVLNIGGSNPRMIPSKIFEYMSNGKPIISTYHDDNDASIIYLKKYPLAFLLDIRSGKWQDELYRFKEFVVNNAGKKLDYERVEPLFERNMPNGYVEIVDKLLK